MWSNPSAADDELEIDSRATSPRFCPGCGGGVEAGVTLCPKCGEATRLQGYCGVCERFWPRGIGQACPKHEIKLDEAPVDPSDLLPPGSRWVTVQRFVDAMAAHAARIRLEAEGIPTFLEGTRMGGREMYQVATGGVKLQVPDSLLADARVLLSQTFATSADDDLDDAWDDLAPAPGAFMRQVALILCVVGTVLWFVGIAAMILVRLF